MSVIEAIILGIIQGISEFLPISSTGHLTLAGKLMGKISTEHPEHWTAFIAVIQLGTLAAVCIYFYKEQSLNAKMGWFISLGTVPIVVFGLGFKSIIEGVLTKNLYVISGSLIVLAIILAIAEKTAKFKRSMEDLTWKDALIIGVAQAIALIPGSSRSGTTITGGLFCGLTRETAARFSFLISIPAIFASGLLELKHSLVFMDNDMLLATLIATIASGISGYMAIDLLLKYLKKNTTFVFIYYRIAIGIIILALLGMNIIQP
ncbi:MAG: undecaprenyl-diphosphatase UppP [Ignavibacteriales bacterium]|nr:undecaprenyl-diphosphatase UppP [Ignavibacteriales bacterium]